MKRRNLNQTKTPLHHAGDFDLNPYESLDREDRLDWANQRNLWVKNFGIELSSQEVPLQVFSPIYNVSPLSSRWISVGPLNTLETPKQKSTF